MTDMAFQLAVLLVLFLGLPALVGALVLVDRTGRRPKAEECPHCGYSLAGLKGEGPCPECGKPAAGARRRFHTPARDRAGAILLGSIPAVMAFGASQFILAVLTDTSPAETFSAMFHLPAMGVLIGFVLWSSSRIDRSSVVRMSIAGATTQVVALTLAYLDAFEWHPDAQGGLVVLIAPLIGGSGLGYGLFAAAWFVRPRSRATGET